VTAECYARLSHRLCVCLPVCHIRGLYQNGVRWAYEIFTVKCPKDPSFGDKISCLWVTRFPLNESVKEEYPLKKTLFCRYWFL